MTWLQEKVFQHGKENKNLMQYYFYCILNNIQKLHMG